MCPRPRRNPWRHAGDVSFASLKTTGSNIRNDWYTHCLRYTVHCTTKWIVIFVYISAMCCNASHSSVSASGPLPWLELDPEGSLAVGGAVNLPPRVCSVGQEQGFGPKQSMKWCKKLKGPGHLQTPQFGGSVTYPKICCLFKEVPTSLKKCGAL